MAVGRQEWQSVEGLEGGVRGDFLLVLAEIFSPSLPSLCKELEQSWQKWCQQKNLIFTLDTFATDRY